MSGSLEEGLPASAAALLDIQPPIADLTGILGRPGDDLAIERRGFVHDDGDEWAIHHLTVAYTINCQYAVGVAGSSQFEVLAELSSDAGIPWGQITVSHLDEYVGLDPTHPASFRRFLHEPFVDRLPMAPAAFHELKGQAADAAKECERLAGLVPAAPFDVAMIGIGENAHLAFNDPPADFLAKGAGIPAGETCMAS